MTNKFIQCKQSSKGHEAGCTTKLSLTIHGAGTHEVSIYISLITVALDSPSPDVLKGYGFGFATSKESEGKAMQQVCIS